MHKLQAGCSKTAQSRTNYPCPQYTVTVKIIWCICNFVIKGEDKQCNNIASICKKKINTLNTVK